MSLVDDGEIAGGFAYTPVLNSGSSSSCMKEFEFPESPTYPNALAWSRWGMIAIVLDRIVYILVCHEILTVDLACIVDERDG
jgi:hypothetical protein